jgi:hypothetical protein
MRGSILTIVLVQLLCFSAISADFLTGARGGGMGFSYFILADDPSGALYNPSGLGFAGGWQSQLMYYNQNDYEYPNWPEHPYGGHFAIVYYKPELGAFALNTLQRGSLSKVTGIPTVNHAVLSYGREFAPGWSAGASVKYLIEAMFGERSSFDFDVALTFRMDNGLMAAAAAENIIRSRLSPDYFGVTEYLPRRGRLGLGYSHGTWDWRAVFLLAGQLEESGISQKYTTPLVNLGTEWWIKPYHTISIGARAGYVFGKGVRYDTETDYSSLLSGVSFNFKIGVNDLRLDYSLMTYPYETTDGSTPLDHFLGITYGWAGVPTYGLHDDEYLEPVQFEPYRNQQTSEPPEIFNPPPGSEIKPPVIDKDTDFSGRSYLPFDVDMDVADISSKDFKRIVFYLRPREIIKTVSWKLYVFKAKIKNWSETEIDRWALKVIEGKGLPPINVVWDGISGDGKLLPASRYYYILTAVDMQGQQLATKWHNFKLK